MELRERFGGDPMDQPMAGKAGDVILCALLLATGIAIVLKVRAVAHAHNRLCWKVSDSVSDLYDRLRSRKAQE